MRHDARDESGMYRPISDAEARCERAKRETQTHTGRFTHERDSDERRMSLAVTQTKPASFKNYRVNRDGYHPKVTK